MADYKKNQAPSDDLKASSIAPDVALTPVVENKKKIRKAPKTKKPRKKGLPIAVDIIIVVALLAMIAGGIWGVFAIREYFSTRYAEKEVTYTLLATNVDAELALDQDGKCVVKPDSDVFVVDQDRDTPIGRVYSVSFEQNEDGTVNIYVVARIKANYNYTLGYFADQVKIAVGKSYTCRFSSLVSDARIIELQIKDKES